MADIVSRTTSQTRQSRRRRFNQAKLRSPTQRRFWTTNPFCPTRPDTSRNLFALVRLVWADGGYNARQVSQATSIRVEIVSKIVGQAGFVVLPRRWVVERFFAWINRNRRLARDVEATIKSAAAFLYAAPAMIMIRRLARSP